MPEPDVEVVFRLWRTRLTVMQVRSLFYMMGSSECRYCFGKTIHSTLYFFLALSSLFGLLSLLRELHLALKTASYVDLGGGVLLWPEMTVHANALLRR